MDNHDLASSDGSLESPASRSPPQAEPDTLPRNRRLELVPGGTLHDDLARAYESTLRYARDMVLRAASEPDRAVHEFRKSLRRLRALLKLVRRPLGGKQFRALQDCLRSAIGATSAQRDCDVMLATLDSLALPPEHETWRAQARAALERRPNGAADPVQPGALQLLHAESGAVAGTAATFRTALPVQIGWPELERGLVDGFRRARRALEVARVDEKSESIHRLRKRVKELRYQTELLRTVGGEEFEQRRSALARMAESLGRVTDRLVLRSRLGADDMDGDFRRPLRRFLRRDIRQSFRAIVQERTCLREKPRRFAQSIQAALPR